MIPQFRSLRSRILVLATLPLVGLLLALLWLSHSATTRSVEEGATGRLENAASVFTELVASRHAALAAQARVTGSDPRFFATFSVPPEERDAEFVGTMRLLAHDFLQITDARFIEVYTAGGSRMLRSSRDAADSSAWSDSGAGRASILVAAQRTVSRDLFLSGGRPVMVADVPVFLGPRQEAVLRMGRFLDDEFATEVQRLTGAQLAIGRGRDIVVSTWAADALDSLPWLGNSPGSAGVQRSEVQRFEAPDEEYLAIDLLFAGTGAESGFVARLGRSTAAELANLHETERLMIAIGLAALLLTVAGSLLIAFSVTRPLRSLIASARRITQGDYSEPVAVQGRDEVALLAATFEESRRALSAHVRRLEELDQRRGEFLTLTGHEIRTPLTVITSFNDMLHDGGFGELPPEVEETALLIKSKLAHLNDTVTDIIDLTALEQAPDQVLRPQSVHVGSIISRIEELQRPHRAGRQIEVHWTAPVRASWVKGDERLIGRALRSLLDNAVRFTPDGGRISITLEEDAGEVAVAVTDTGIGISPDDIRWVCDKLYEGGDIEHHSSGGLEFRSSGLGLGLSITRAVAAAHGGRLDVQSRPGQGSCFTLYFPAASGPEHPDALEQFTPEGLRC